MGVVNVWSGVLVVEVVVAVGRVVDISSRVVVEETVGVVDVWNVVVGPSPSYPDVVVVVDVRPPTIIIL